jgi:nitrate reductase alpha subunit
VNCTGGCSWAIYVKDGIVTWELQQTDYPTIAPELPTYEPRGCPRGISSSWYIYSPIRVRYPYIRGALLDLWLKAKSEFPNPVDAWSSIVNDLASRRRFHQARGKGGFRRTTWEDALEIIAASTIYTIQRHGPDRIIGFSPIPAMSMVSYASGSRFLQLLGGVNLSFYDWYADLPPASPQVWGEQTDVCESADWYNSAFTVTMGSNVSMTRTPDVHFLAESRYAGSKLVSFSPDFSQVSKYADWWIPIRAGQDGAFWSAVNHVILEEFFFKQKTPFFINYLKRYTDAPFLVALESNGESFAAGKFLRANRLSRYKDAENGDWKLLVYDVQTDSPKAPLGTIGFRWQEKKGQWNLELKDALDGKEIDPALTLIQGSHEVVKVDIPDFAADRTFKREVPAKQIQLEDGSRVLVATVFDLLMAQSGVARELGGEYPKDYDDNAVPFTPSWQEKFTGIDRKTVIEFARQWAETAKKTEGRCMIIIGAGVNHWYQTDLIYRACITSLMLCGCVGRNGGGLAHYVGQEKVTPLASWSTIAFAQDWVKPSRFQNAPSFHYVHSGQWRYDGAIWQYYSALQGKTVDHAIDAQIRAVHMGWLPFFPQFNKNPLDLFTEAERSGARTDQDKARWVANQLKEKRLQFAVEDPDDPVNWPRLWFIWRGNALLASAKGHEYFLKHYLGTHTNAIADEVAEGLTSEVTWRKACPEGKFDLIVDVNFRMDTSALYSDLILPAATWYEKDDLNTTDLHSYIHPLCAAVPPCWESKSDWEIFKSIAKKVSELAATHLPTPVKEIIAVPLQHDTPDELAQPSVKDWTKGECEPVPGKTMPHFKVVERDYVNLYNRFVSLGPLARKDGLGAHGVHWEIEDLYDDLTHRNSFNWPDHHAYPSLSNAVDAANAILQLAPETNGEVAYRAFLSEETRSGRTLSDLAEKYRGVDFSFDDIVQQPRRVLTSPIWSGVTNGGRAYAQFAINVERLIPWRTLTGRQHFYLDHDLYLQYGENLPTYKPKPDAVALGELTKSMNGSEGKQVVLNFLTPHGKWHIHSTYFDNLRMLTLSRGLEPLWLSDKDADSIGVRDNDWVEVYNDNGVVVTKAIVSARIPNGICMLYHSPERTISVPKSPRRGYRRAGGHNSLTRLRLKPSLMAGGYAQFTYAFNYWGPTGVNRDTFAVVRKLGEEPSW